MKKILTLACMLIMGMGLAHAQAEQGQTAAGINLVYGSEIESMGLGARFQYGIIDHLRGEVGFNYFFEHKHMSWWDINLNAHYLVNLKDNMFYIYPLAGLNYTAVDYKGEYNDKGENNHLGLNLGIGLEYEINDKFGVNLEYRHTIIRKVDQGIIGLGLNYKF
ncbi:MAG: porin family protein [Muribaculaceae bacterium]|nr:porin family protein [Muribaculaceae bacterium]